MVSDTTNEIMRINIRYTETLKQVLGLIIVPIVYMLTFTALAIGLYDTMSEGLWMLLLLGGIILVIAVAVFTIRTFIIEAGETFFDDKGLHILLKRRTFLYPHQQVFIPYSHIAEAGFNIEPSKGGFINITTRLPKKSLMIFPENYGNPDSFTDFWHGLEAAMNKINQAETDTSKGIIKSSGFYEHPFIRSFALISAITAIIATVMRWNDPTAISSWKLIGFYCYVIPLCAAVIGHKKV